MAKLDCRLGSVKNIRMQVENERGLAIFRAKSDLERMIVVMSKQDVAGSHLLMEDTDSYLYIVNNTQVEVIETSQSEYSTDPLYRVSVREGPERGSRGWLMAMDLK